MQTYDSSLFYSILQVWHVLYGSRSILSTVRFRRNMWPPSYSAMSWAPLLFYCPRCHVSQYVWEVSCSPCGEMTVETSNWPLTHSEYVRHTEWMILLMWLSFVMQGIFSKCSKMQEATVTEGKLKIPSAVRIPTEMACSMRERWLCTFLKLTSLFSVLGIPVRLTDIEGDDWHFSTNELY